MASNPHNAESLMKAIAQVIEGEAVKLQENAIKEAVASFERQLRIAVGGAAVNVSNFYSMRTMGEELVIHVKIEANR